MVPSHLPNHNKRCTPALRLHVREVMFVLYKCAGCDFSAWDATNSPSKIAFE